MAERIGEAYVRVFFKGDNSGLRDMERQLAKEQKGLNKTGKDASDHYWDGLDEEWTKRMRKRFADNEKAWDNHIKAWRDKTGKIVTDTQKIFDRYDKWWENRNRKEGDDFGHSVEDQLKKMADLRTQVKRSERDWERLFQTQGNGWDRLKFALRLWAIEAKNKFSEVGQRFSRLGRDIRDNWRSWVGTLGASLANMFVHPIESVKVFSGWVAGLGESFRGVFSKLGPISTFFGKFGALLTARGNSIDKFSDKLSGTFGRRSGWAVAGANVFLRGPMEALGKIMQIGGKFFSLFSQQVPQALEETTKAAEGMGKELESAGSGASGLATTAEEAASSLGPYGLAGLAIVAVGAVSALGSAIMLTTGAVIALASSLSFALVGAAGALVVALLPLGVALGTVMLAMQGLQNSKGKATGALKEIGAEFKKLGKIASGEIFTPKLMSGLADMLKGITPLIKETASWVGGLGQSFMDAANGPGGKAFMAFLGRRIPSMLQQWTPILKNVAKFLGDLFRVVAAPGGPAEQFLGWLQGITDALAGLGEGGKKSKLASFFDSAWQSAKKVGDAVGQLLGLIGDLLFNKDAKKAGDDMFTSLANNIRTFREWLAKPENQKQMKQLFEDGKKFAGALGEAVIQVGKLIGALDTPEMRKTIIFLLKSFNRIVGFVAEWVRMYGRVWHWIFLIASKVPKIADGIKTAGNAIQRAWNKALSWISGKLGDLRGLAGRVGGAIGRAFQNAGSAITGAIRSAGNKIQSVWNSVTGAIKTGISNAASWVSGKISDIVGWFQSLPGKITNINWASVGKSIGDAIKSAISTAMSGLPDTIVRMFSGLASRILSAIGNINVGSLLTGPSKLINKVLHNASGGLVTGPSMRLVGEAGPEAIVPLNRPLNQVDPAVRALSAIAQGKALGGVATIDKGRRIDVGGITVITPVKDPAAVAQQVVNRIAATSYI